MVKAELLSNPTITRKIALNPQDIFKTKKKRKNKKNSTFIPPLT